MLHRLLFRSFQLYPHCHWGPRIVQFKGLPDPLPFVRIFVLLEAMVPLHIPLGCQNR